MVRISRQKPRERNRDGTKNKGVAKVGILPNYIKWLSYKSPWTACASFAIVNDLNWLSSDSECTKSIFIDIAK